MSTDYITIKDERGYSIILDNIKSIFAVTLKMDVEYNEEKYDEFLLYFSGTWDSIRVQNLRYHLMINLGSDDKKENELPLAAYVKLVKMMTGINETLILHCHSVCILTTGSKKWKTAYELATKLWKPVKQRPLFFTEDETEVTQFFNSHKLYEDVSEWVPCEDGGFTRVK